MRIVDIHATPVAVPFNGPEMWGWGGRSGVTSVVVEVATDEGLSGVGEATGFPDAEIVLASIQSLKGLVVGESPFHIERILKKIAALGGWHHIRGTSTGISAVEMACWDIVGKACNQPLANLFGGPVRDRVEYFYYLVRRSPSEMATEARFAVEQGYRTLYLAACSDTPTADIERVEAVRDGAGPEALIRVDANETWSSAAAIRIVSEMERFDLELVEQPVSGSNLAELAYVRSRLNTPLLSNEASWTAKDVLAVIRHGAADVVALDNQLDGGLLNMKRTAGLCEIAGLPVVKHSLGELGIATYAALHVLASTPNFLYANQSYSSLLTDDIIRESADPGPGRGHLVVPSGPGIGVTLDQEKVSEYAELYRRGGSLKVGAPDASAPTPVIPRL